MKRVEYLRLYLILIKNKLKVNIHIRISYRFSDIKMYQILYLRYQFIVLAGLVSNLKSLSISTSDSGSKLLIFSQVSNRLLTSF